MNAQTAVLEAATIRQHCKVLHLPAGSMALPCESASAIYIDFSRTAAEGFKCSLGPRAGCQPNAL